MVRPRRTRERDEASIRKGGASSRGCSRSEQGLIGLCSRTDRSARLEGRRPSLGSGERAARGTRRPRGRVLHLVESRGCPASGARSHVVRRGGSPRGAAGPKERPHVPGEEFVVVLRSCGDDSCMTHPECHRILLHSRGTPGGLIGLYPVRSALTHHPTGPTRHRGGSAFVRHPLATLTWAAPEDGPRADADIRLETAPSSAEDPVAIRPGSAPRRQSARCRNRSPPGPCRRRTSPCSAPARDRRPRLRAPSPGRRRR